MQIFAGGHALHGMQSLHCNAVFGWVWDNDRNMMKIILWSTADTAANPSQSANQSKQIPCIDDPAIPNILQTLQTLNCVWFEALKRANRGLRSCWIFHQMGENCVFASWTVNFAISGRCHLTLAGWELGWADRLNEYCGHILDSCESQHCSN